MSKDVLNVKLATELKMVTEMTSQQLIRFCYENGVENAIIYDLQMLREIAVQIIIKNRRYKNER